VPWLQEGGQDRLAGSASMDGFVAQQPSCSHGTYQHEAIASRSRQFLMIGTWLPETCLATSRREIKNTKVTSSWFFLSILSLENIHFSASRALFKKARFYTKTISIIQIANLSVFELWVPKSSKQELGAVQTESLTKILFSLRVFMAKVAL
jgi:hypothetical protein